MEWIKPTGRTRSEIDAEAIKEVLAKEKHDAEEYLKATDQEVLAAIEKHLLDAIGKTLVEDRQKAREKLLEASFVGK